MNLEFSDLLSHEQDRFGDICDSWRNVGAAFNVDEYGQLMIIEPISRRKTGLPQRKESYPLLNRGEFETAVKRSLPAGKKNIDTGTLTGTFNSILRANFDFDDPESRRYTNRGAEDIAFQVLDKDTIEESLVSITGLAFNLHKIREFYSVGTRKMAVCNALIGAYGFKVVDFEESEKFDRRIQALSNQKDVLLDSLLPNQTQA